MNTADWQDFLKEESRQIIADNLCETSNGVPELWQHSKLSNEAVQSEWLGIEGATESQIQATEERLGIALPASYRNFLSVTNGWNDWQVGSLRLYSTEEVCWFRDNNQDWIDDLVDGSYIEGYDDSIPDERYFTYGKAQSSNDIRIEYLQSALQISVASEGSVILLNPIIVANGEWEALLFSDHLGGGPRYRTFSEMIQIKGLTETWL
jgi:hypothetical protein